MIEIERPVANPFQAPPGPVVLTTRVRVDASATHIVRIIVYEGSFWPGHGTELWRKDVTVWLGQDWTTIQVTHPSVEGTIDRRDVKVEVYDTNFNFLVIEREWDDVFYVTPSDDEEPPDDDEEEGRFPWGFAAIGIGLVAILASFGLKKK